MNLSQAIRARVIDRYMEGSVIVYQGELVEEIIAAQQGGGAPTAAEEGCFAAS